MYLSDLAILFDTKFDSEFQNLKVTVLNISNAYILFEGSVSDFITKIYTFELSKAFMVCEILRDTDSKYSNLPIYNKPMVITVI